MENRPMIAIPDRYATIGVDRSGDRIPGRRSGFTLVELMLVVAVLALMASVVIPAAAPDRYSALAASANSLAADLRLARSYAINYATEYAVEFDLQRQRYTVLHVGDGDAPVPQNPLLPSGGETTTYIVDVGRNQRALTGGFTPRIVSVSTAQRGAAVTRVVFHKTGTTAPELIEDTLITLAAGAEGAPRRIVRISWLTGHVVIE
ncbi:MAG: type II secretion system protein GspH [Planctomycetota bacterium]|nr:MAG: type II secretion system protein GspH [Planctomycetota bacterium]